MRPLVVSCILFAAVAATAAAEERQPLRLLDDDSLIGWDHWDTQSSGWTIEKGRLSGDSLTVMLLSGWTFGDFELRFRWSVGEDGQWNLAFPADSGRLLVVALKEGQDAATILLDYVTITAGGNLPAAGEKGHTGVLRRQGATLSLDVDGDRIVETDISAKERFGLVLSREGDGSLWDLTLDEPPGLPLFNGVDLTGWWTPGNIDSWKVEHGEIVCTNREGNYLRSERQFSDFTLSFEYKLARDGNSGVGIRTPRDGWPSGDGIELQLLDEPPGTPLTRSTTMSLYGNLEPIARADRSEEWNRAVIRAQGSMISAWVNGVLVQNSNTALLPELKHRHLAGWIGFQDHGDGIRFRNVRLSELPVNHRTAAWNDWRPEHDSVQVLDRLMNTERLSRFDGITARVALKTLTESGEAVLADLEGPGAVVRWMGSSDMGRVAFYFDGEREPRIDCSMESLRTHIPSLSEDSAPILTYVPFAGRLRIVARDALAGEYAIDYVTLPAVAPVESFVDRERSVARGLLPAISYRYEQLGWGTHREFDPALRFESPRRSLAVGEKARLGSLFGAGIVRWMKLLAGAETLANDDLWLEVTIDGESAPAIAAPARYFFPGLDGIGEYHNFVTVFRGGPTSLLAMPYRAGLTIAAENRGPTPIADLGISVSYEPANDETREEVARRMRLRGSFQRAAESDSVVHLEGKGRWIGLVCAAGEGDGHGRLASLVVDGREREGWENLSLDSFLGSRGEPDFLRATSGRHGGLAWRYLLLEAVPFESSLTLAAGKGTAIGDRLALYYVRP